MPLQNILSGLSQTVEYGLRHHLLCRWVKLYVLFAYCLHMVCIWFMFVSWFGYGLSHGCRMVCVEMAGRASQEALRWHLSPLSWGTLLRLARCAMLDPGDGGLGADGGIPNGPGAGAREARGGRV